MVGNIQRGYVSGTKLLAEKRSTWRDNGVSQVVEAVGNAAAARMDFLEREKNLVWKRLNLEAAKLQEEELAAIKTASSIDEIPGIIGGFEEKLRNNMKDQKWGKEWMENLGNGFLSYNEQDVAAAVRNKEKEFETINLNNTLKAYADKIAAAPEDEAVFLSDDADGLIDGSGYLTPTEKENIRNQFTNLAISGMVNTNPETAKKALSESGRFKNLTDLQRKEYLQKADDILAAREKDRISAEERAKKANKEAADLNIHRAGYLYEAGEMNAEEAIKVADDNYMISPQTALALRERVLGKPGKENSDPDVLKTLGDKIINGTATKKELVVANRNNELSDEDYKELLAQGKELGLWSEGEDNDAQYRENMSLANEGREAVNQAFARGNINKKTRDALLKDIGEREKLATEVWEAGLKLRMSDGEIVDVDAELENAPYPLQATEKVNSLKEYQDKIVNKKAAERKADQEGLNALLNDLKEKQKLNLYIDTRNRIDAATSVADLPSDKEINEMERDGMSSERAGKLRTAKENKKKELSPTAEGITNEDKFVYYENVETKISEVLQRQQNGTADIKDFEGLASMITNGVSEGYLSKAEGTSFFNNLYLPYVAEYDELMDTTGGKKRSWIPWFKKVSQLQKFIDSIYGEDDYDEDDKELNGEKISNSEYRAWKQRKARAALPVYKMYFDKFNELSAGTPVSALSGKQLDEYHKEALEYVQENWQFDNPGKGFTNSDLYIGNFGVKEASRYLSDSYSGTEKLSIWNKYLERSPGLSPSEKKRTLKALIDEEVVKDLSLPRFANEEEAQQAYLRGEINKGDTIFINGNKGKL